MKKYFIELLLCLMTCWNSLAATVRYVDLSSLGKPLDGLTIKFAGPSDGALPTSVFFEHRNGKVSGIILTYSKAISLSDLRDALNKEFAKYVHDTKTPDVYAWRNEELKYVIGVGKDGDDYASMTIRSHAKF